MIVGEFRDCQCPLCDTEWFHLASATHIVCPRCCADLTLTFMIADEQEDEDATM